MAISTVENFGGKNCSPTKVLESTVVEVGCGHGRFADVSRKTHQVDISPRLRLDTYRRRWANTRLTL